MCGFHKDLKNFRVQTLHKTKWTRYFFGEYFHSVVGSQTRITEVSTIDGLRLTTATSSSTSVSPGTMVDVPVRGVGISSTPYVEGFRSNSLYSCRLRGSGTFSPIV